MSISPPITQSADQAARLRRARGEFVRSVIVDEEERSARFVALRIGLAPSSMSERLKGKSPFLADELENVARALRIDPLAFYSRYIAVGTQEVPTSEETDPRAGASRRNYIVMPDVDLCTPWDLNPEPTV